MILFNIYSIENLIPSIKKLYSEQFDIDLETELSESYKLELLVCSLKENLFVLLEFPYIDKLYRDSYYTYFSTKRLQHNRNTIRVSFFDKEIKSSDFLDVSKHSYLQSAFKGFLIFRPLRKLFGRNVISPTIFKNSNMSIRNAMFEIFIQGVRLKVVGFPHSSQDSETTTCSEISLWILMEYFGTKYPEYSTILPSKIRESIKSVKVENPLPSSGLTLREMQYAFKYFGLNGYLYNLSEYDSDASDKFSNFYSMMNSYIDSGIPFVLEVQKRGSGINHAMLCIGREEKPLLNRDSIKKIILINGREIYDFNNFERTIIVMDDNSLPYQKTKSTTITSYYKDLLKYEIKGQIESWTNCHINSILVPCHPRIYLEAYLARACIISLLGTDVIPMEKSKKYFIRLFLTSSKSLKYNLLINSEFNEDLKAYILQQELPKFTWICEILDEVNLPDFKAIGIILLDATEPDYKMFKPLILGAIGDNLIINMGKYIDYRKLSVPLQPFSIFNDNLKNFS